MLIFLSVHDTTCFYACLLTQPASQTPLTGYMLWWEVPNVRSSRVERALSNSTLEYQLTGLTSTTAYTIQVAALTGAGQGVVTSSTVSTGVPPGAVNKQANMREPVKMDARVSTLVLCVCLRVGVYVCVCVLAWQSKYEWWALMKPLPFFRLISGCFCASMNHRPHCRHTLSHSHSDKKVCHLLRLSSSHFTVCVLFARLPLWAWQVHVTAQVAVIIRADLTADKRCNN